MDQREVICTIALSRLQGLSQVGARMLCQKAGSAAAVADARRSLRDIVPEASQKVCDALANEQHWNEAYKRAEVEWEFAQKNHIRCLCQMGDPDYPQMLCECDDAPLVLFYMGTANLNAPHIVSMVGTRRITPYGKDLCQRFVSDLKEVVPDALIVSGLAYGVDIASHRAALNCGMSTVGVLAHGLDTIYPAMHRKDAAKMTHQGGLLTEHISQTVIMPGNFVRRNRIVAGMAAATIVVESGRKGGALITAELAQEYNRDVFAFPGRIGDEYSEGCNRLIAKRGADLITSAEDFLLAVGWAEPKQKKADKNPQLELFATLSPEEQSIMNALSGSDAKQINQIVVETNLPYSQVAATLFELELKGLVSVLGGARYRKTMR